MPAEAPFAADALQGVFPVFQTPFHADESIDFDTLAREIDWLLNRGVDGLVMAMVSEVLRLSGEERRAVAQFVCDRAANRRPVVVSVGAESAHTAVEFARHAESCGAAAVMAIPPIATAPTDEQIRGYYRRILAAIEIPVIVQDASGYVGRPLSIEAQAALLREFGPSRVLFKPEAVPLGPNITALRNATSGEARIFEGSGGIALVDSFRRGVVGTMPGADLVEIITPLWRALNDGDQPRAARLALPLTALVSLQSGLDGFLAVEKHLLVRQGIFQNTIVRGPVAFELDDETRLEVDRLFDLAMQAKDERP